MSDTLYNPEILRLATDMPHGQRLAAPHASVERRSPVCGSRVTVDVTMGPDGRIAELGMLVRACALGQASAALFAKAAVGRSGEELATASDALTRWLAGAGEMPAWPGLGVLAPALAYHARHPSIRLAFEAGAAAADAALTARRDAA
jgi:NifU-like protein involved in Fe-S cluster formation